MDIKRIPIPNGTNNEAILKQLKQIVTEKKIAGFIYEPLVQGAAGMKMHDADSLNKVLSICRDHNVILIADEVMTGFGKTGKHFASDWMKIKPDIMCLSKALSAGVVPLAVTTCAQHIYDAFYDEDVNKGFFHAHTYSANQLLVQLLLPQLHYYNLEIFKKTLN